MRLREKLHYSIPYNKVFFLSKQLYKYELIFVLTKNVEESLLNLLYVCSITLQQSTGQAAIIKDEGPFCICLYQCNTRISRTKNLLLGPKNYQKRPFESGLRFGSNCCPLGWRDCALFAIFEFIHNAADYTNF